MATKYRVIAIQQVAALRQQLAANDIQVTIGYHATKQQFIDSILNNGFIPSREDYDWLGDGTYVFEEDLDRAIDWANKRAPTEPAVIGMLLRLNDCMDIPRRRRYWLDQLQSAEKQVRTFHKRNGIQLPRQIRGAHRRDRLVFNRVAEQLTEQGTVVPSVRELFEEGKRAWPHSAIRTQSHIQIAIRDDSIIEAVWVLQTPADFQEASEL